jgi:hypothetical protein
MPRFRPARLTTGFGGCLVEADLYIGFTPQAPQPQFPFFVGATLEKRFLELGALAVATALTLAALQ